MSCLRVPAATVFDFDTVSQVQIGIIVLFERQCDIYVCTTWCHDKRIENNNNIQYLRRIVETTINTSIVHMVDVHDINQNRHNDIIKSWAKVPKYSNSYILLKSLIKW